MATETARLRVRSALEARSLAFIDDHLPVIYLIMNEVLMDTHVALAPCNATAAAAELIYLNFKFCRIATEFLRRGGLVQGVSVS
jgi:hypothetical protein